MQRLKHSLAGDQTEAVAAGVAAAIVVAGAVVALVRRAGLGGE